MIVELLLARGMRTRGVVVERSTGAMLQTLTPSSMSWLAPVGFLERLIGCVLVRLLANRLSGQRFQITKNMVLPFSV